MWTSKASPSLNLVRTLLPSAKGVRLLGVTVSNFDREPMSATNGLPLFETSEAIVRPSDDASNATNGLREGASVRVR
jgi:hypothetical protein